MSAIRNLIQEVQSGARSNKYRVLVPIDGESSRRIDVLCHSSKIPGRNLGAIDVFVRGNKCQIAGETNIDGSWEMTFYNTSDLEMRNFFIKWMEDIHSLSIPNFGGVLGLNELNSAIQKGKSIIQDFKDTSKRLSTLAKDPVKSFLGKSKIVPSYQKEIVIQQLDNEGESQNEVTLINCFPINVSDIDLSDESGEITSTTVTFAYSDIRIGSQPNLSPVSVIFGDQLGSL